MGWTYVQNLEPGQRSESLLDRYIFQSWRREGVTIHSYAIRPAFDGEQAVYCAISEKVAPAKIEMIVVLFKRSGGFGWKDLHESMEPYYYDCPQEIFELLTPTDSPGAVAWREHVMAKLGGKQLTLC